MNIAILGYGVEGKSIERYFKNRQDQTTSQPHHITIFEKLSPAELKTFKTADYDLVFRSPSVRPYDHNWTSITKYFFDHCPCPIIGVTGTKGKGTTCSITTALLRALGTTAHLLGNIGTPALDLLDEIQSTDVVVYEMSSFQLWDLEKSPHISLILRLEPDHLDVHTDYQEYITAKSHIAAHQTAQDTCIYFKSSPDSKTLAKTSKGTLVPYPIDNLPSLESLLDHLAVPGAHNRENATAALLAVAALKNTSLTTLLETHHSALATALKNFTALPHHTEYLRTLNGVDYYDDNYSTAFPSLDVALKAFPGRPLILIAGGKDKGIDLGDIKHAIFTNPYLLKAIFIGEIKTKLAAGEDPNRFALADSLAAAFALAKKTAETAAKDHPAPRHPIVLMSPAAASLDMFKSYSDRGDQFQFLVTSAR